LNESRKQVDQDSASGNERDQEFPSPADRGSKEALFERVERKEEKKEKESENLEVQDISVDDL